MRLKFYIFFSVFFILNSYCVAMDLRSCVKKIFKENYFEADDWIDVPVDLEALPYKVDYTQEDDKEIIEIFNPIIDPQKKTTDLDNEYIAKGKLYYFGIEKIKQNHQISKRYFSKVFLHSDNLCSKKIAYDFLKKINTIEQKKKLKEESKEESKEELLIEIDL